MGIVYCCLSFDKILGRFVCKMCQLLVPKKKIKKNSNLKSQSVNCVGAIDTCQLLMLTKYVNCYLKFSCLLTKMLQMHQKQLTHLPIQCIMQYKHNVLLRTCHLNYSIGNVSIVSYLCTIINYTNTLTKLTLMHTCVSGIGWWSIWLVL